MMTQQLVAHVAPFLPPESFATISSAAQTITRNSYITFGGREMSTLG